MDYPLAALPLTVETRAMQDSSAARLPQGTSRRSDPGDPGSWPFGYRPGALRRYRSYTQAHYRTCWTCRMNCGRNGPGSRRVAQALRTTLQAPGLQYGMNNFEAAGQVVFHAHLHIVPRYLKRWPQAFSPGEL